MTYFEILGVMIVPPLLLLVGFLSSDIRSWLIHRSEKPDFSSYLILMIIVIIALIYTTPWDNYLVATSVWWYNPALVIGIRLGWVPIEEYIFFILQSLLTGSITIILMRFFKSEHFQSVDKPGTRLVASMIVGVLWLASVGLLFSGWKPGTYLALILTWALVPIWIQFFFGADILLIHRKVLLLAILPVTMYLWLLDITALRAGIWTIDSFQTTGLKMGILPIEEMLFFLMTNVLIVIGVILMLSPDSRRRLSRHIERIRCRFNKHKDPLNAY